MRAATMGCLRGDPRRASPRAQPAPSPLSDAAKIPQCRRQLPLDGRKMSSPSLPSRAGPESSSEVEARDSFPCCRDHLDLVGAALASKSSVRIDVDSSTADLSLPGGSPDKICRICHGDSPVEGLRSLCRCRGTVGLVHKECLEAWLSASGSARCELCGFQFELSRVPRHRLARAFWLWVTTEADRTQLLVDLVWFCLMTPFAALSGYLIYRSLHRYKELMRVDGAPLAAPERNEPTMVNLVLLMSCLTLAVYYAWAVAIVQYHARWWYRWWLTTFVVTVVEPPDAAPPDEPA
ncbi:E3 ubiquitin-protein ligase MARCHF3-like [Bacillus rossius redtenbacheri]|uniref:E3 ubiquitin-protein ligase MARCHF3-like n=1 Tax=Bacillus rossius redtenbacheri TaxID=93214 RepID=UPI002FDEB2E7